MNLLDNFLYTRAHDSRHFVAKFQVPEADWKIVSRLRHLLNAIVVEEIFADVGVLRFVIRNEDRLSFYKLFGRTGSPSSSSADDCSSCSSEDPMSPSFKRQPVLHFPPVEDSDSSASTTLV